MHDEPKVGFVDSHSKRIGGDDDFDFATHEPFLDLASPIGSQASMVKGDTAFYFVLQKLDQMFAIFSRRSVNDSAAGSGVEEIDQLVVFDHIAVGRLDGQVQVRTGEAGDKLGWLLQLQNFDDVALDERSRRGGQRDCLRVAQFFAQPPQSSVVGPEVMSPLTNTVGFVNSEQLDLRFADGSHKRVAAKPFRCNVDELVLSVSHAVNSGLLLFQSQ